MRPPAGRMLLLAVLAAGGCRQILGIGEARFDEPDAGSGGASTSTSSSARTGGSGGGTSSSSGSATSSSGGGMAGSGGTGGASSSSSAASSASGGPSCAIDHLLLSEVRSRGLGGSSDDFVELWNPTDAPIVLDSAWSISAVTVGNAGYTKRWIGDGAILAPHRHYLIASSGYTQAPPPDGTLAPSITDAAVIHLDHGGNTVDILCYFKDTTSSVGVGFYACEGAAVLNPHDDTDPTNVDESLERRPGGDLGHCVDTDDNNADFFVQSPATPRNSASPPTP